MKNRFLKVVGGIGASSLLLLSQAQAATDPAFGNAVTAVSGDISTYGAALVGVAAIGVGFMIAMKYVKKISRAA